jgi:hypothetical protein
LIYHLTLRYIVSLSRISSIFILYFEHLDNLEPFISPLYLYFFHFLLYRYFRIHACIPYGPFASTSTAPFPSTFFFLDPLYSPSRALSASIIIDLSHIYTTQLAVHTSFTRSRVKCEMQLFQTRTQNSCVDHPPEIYLQPIMAHHVWSEGIGASIPRRSRTKLNCGLPDRRRQ